MRRFEKWLTGIKPDDPVDRAARQALAMRLTAVQHYMSEAVKGDDQQEGIHQLRIWTRRAAAALRLFRPALAGVRKKWIKKTLRKLRRLAGGVRDCDVYLEQLELAGAQAPKSVLKRLRQDRRQAQKKLTARRRQLLRKKRFPRRVQELIAGIAWPKRHSSREAPAYGDWCRQQIEPLGEQFLLLASQDLSDDQRLHKFRLAGKRLRYALELTGPAISPQLQQELYDELSAVQDRLGKVCDHMTATERVRKWLAESRKIADQQKLIGLVRKEQQALAASRRKFAQWWSAARLTRMTRKWHDAMDGGGP